MIPTLVVLLVEGKEYDHCTALLPLESIEESISMLTPTPTVIFAPILPDNVHPPEDVCFCESAALARLLEYDEVTCFTELAVLAAVLVTFLAALDTVFVTEEAVDLTVLATFVTALATLLPMLVTVFFTELASAEKAEPMLEATDDAFVVTELLLPLLALLLEEAFKDELTDEDRLLELLEDALLTELLELADADLLELELLEDLDEL